MPVIKGTVKDTMGNPVSRVVRIYRRDTGALVGSGTSDAVTGVYAIMTPHTGEHQAVMLDDSSGVLEQDKIRRVMPQ